MAALDTARRPRGSSVFVVHVKSWRSSLAAGSRPAEMRARVHTVARRTVPDGDGGLIARATLYPEDIAPTITTRTAPSHRCA